MVFFLRVLSPKCASPDTFLKLMSWIFFQCIGPVSIPVIFFQFFFGRIWVLIRPVEFPIVWFYWMYTHGVFQHGLLYFLQTGSSIQGAWSNSGLISLARIWVMSYCLCNRSSSCCLIPIHSVTNAKWLYSTTSFWMIS